LVLWCLAKDSKRFRAFSTCHTYSIHVMAQEQQEQALRFARDGTDFAHADWSPDEAGRPVLTGSLARFDCSLHACHEAGDHLILVGHVDTVMHRPGQGLIFKRGQFGKFLDIL